MRGWRHGREGETDRRDAVKGAASTTKGEPDDRDGALTTACNCTTLPPRHTCAVTRSPTFTWSRAATNALMKLCSLPANGRAARRCRSPRSMMRGYERK